jgi:general nucleoside transport system permease protein
MLPFAQKFNRVFDIIPPVVALLLALLVASGIILAMDASPPEAYKSMLDGAFGNENATAETLVKAIPLMFVAIGICIAFRGGVINIGGEGQMIIGALAGIATALQLRDSSGTVIMAASLFVGFLAGGLYAGVAGLLKAYFNVNEILSTIMLNQVAVQLMNYLLNGILLDPSEEGTNAIPKSERIAEKAQLPRFSLILPEPITDFLKSLGIVSGPELFDRTRLHYGLILVIALALIVYIFLWRTSLGYRIRAVGQNERAARYAGIRVERQLVLSMFLAGGMAGLAGVVQVLGLQYRLQTDGSAGGFTGSAGFNGIVAALFGGLNPIGALPAATFFAALLVGAQKMQRDLGVPASMITAINGLIVIFVVSSQLFIRRRARRRVSSSTGGSPQLKPLTSPAEDVP